MLNRNLKFGTFGILLILTSQLVIANETISLRCAYRVDGYNTNSRIFFDEKGIISHETKQEKMAINNEKGVDYVKIIIGENGYFKLDSERNIYSTNKNESRFNTWNHADINIDITNGSTENRILVVAKIYSSKFGKMNITERITIDRVSGEYEKILNFENNIGSEKKGTSYSIEKLDGYHQHKGVCEKYSPKF